MTYYYDDPLAAAWMAKYFGMNFDATDDGYSWKDYHLLTAERFYIHPDSMHLLEPKSDDLVLHNNKVGYIPSILSQLGSPVGTPPLDFAKYKDAKIIQRNGIAFHWPKEEA